MKKTLTGLLLAISVAWNASCRNGGKLLKFFITPTENLVGRASAHLAIPEMEAIGARYSTSLTMTEMKAMNARYGSSLAIPEMEAIGAKYGTNLTMTEMEAMNARFGGSLTMTEMEAMNARYGSSLTMAEMETINAGSLTSPEIKALSSRFHARVATQESEALADRISGSRIKSPVKIKTSSLRALDSNGHLEGSKAAKDIVNKAELEFTLYDSQGQATLYSKAIDEMLVYRSVERMYKQPLVGIVDDVLLQMSATNKQYTSKMLEDLIHSTVKARLETRIPFKFDVSNGSLTLNLELENGGQIVGTVDMYSMVKKGLIGAAGASGLYHISKKVL